MPGRRYAILFALLAACAAQFANSARSAEPSYRVPVPGNARSGETLAKRWCTSCHILGGGTVGTDAAPPFASLATTAYANPEVLRAFLTAPHGQMPPLLLERSEISDIVAYLRSLPR